MRLRALAPPLLLVASIALVSCGGTGRTDGPVEYRAEDLRTGDQVELADLRGDVVLLSGWATWCAPCREELPAFAALAEERADDGLTVVAVNLDAAGPSKRNALPMLDELAPSLPGWVDRDGVFSELFGAVAMPTNVLLDRDGRVVHTWNGAVDLGDPANLRIIAQALARSASG